jgi:hypothetical protein
MARKIKFQLYEIGSNKLVQASGGVCFVATDGDPTKLAITDVNGTTLTNPRALTNGSCEFYVADTVTQADLFIACPDGQFLVQKDTTPGEWSFYVDPNQRECVAVLPVSKTDYTDAVETDTGYDLPIGAVVKPAPAISVTAIDATEDIDVGILSTETAGDADGFIDSVSLGVLGTAKASLVASADTMGALLSVLDSANAGDDAPEGFPILSTNGQSVSITLSTGTDTAKLYVMLPYTRMAVQ